MGAERAPGPTPAVPSPATALLMSPGVMMDDALEVLRFNGEDEGDALPRASAAALVPILGAAAGERALDMPPLAALSTGLRWAGRSSHPRALAWGVLPPGLGALSDVPNELAGGLNLARRGLLPAASAFPTESSARAVPAAPAGRVGERLTPAPPPLLPWAVTICA